MSSATRERKQRGTYIGGHCATAIMGLHPYREAGDVFAAMVHGYLPDISNNPKVRRGLICEPGLLDRVEEERGPIKRDLHVVGANNLFAGTLDCVESKSGIIHDVTVTDRTSHAWASGLAEYKVLQLQWYMGIIEDCAYCVSKNGLVFDGWPYPIVDHAFLTVFYADTGDIVEHRVEKDHDFIARAKDEVETFLDKNIQEKIPPENVSDDVAKLVYPVDNGEDIEVSEEFISAAEQYAAARDLSKQWSESKKDCSAILKSYLGNASAARWDSPEGENYVTWKNSKGRISIDFQEMAKDLSDKLELGFPELCERYKKERPGARTLRVKIKK